MFYIIHAALLPTTLLSSLTAMCLGSSSQSANCKVALREACGDLIASKAMCRGGNCCCNDTTTRPLLCNQSCGGCSHCPVGLDKVSSAPMPCNEDLSQDPSLYLEVITHCSKMSCLTHSFPPNERSGDIK